MVEEFEKQQVIVFLNLCTAIYVGAGEVESGSSGDLLILTAVLVLEVCTARSAARKVAKSAMLRFSRRDRLPLSTQCSGIFSPLAVSSNTRADTCLQFSPGAHINK